MADWAATFRISFIDPEDFKISFVEHEGFKVSFGEVVEVEHGYDPFPGPYEVIPKRWDQVLATNGKDMTDDVTVKEVPWTEVSNPTGTTFTIAAD